MQIHVLNQRKKKVGEEESYRKNNLNLRATSNAITDNKYLCSKVRAR